MMIGEMDRRVQLQVRTLTTDTTGERVESWTTSYTVFASRTQRQGKTTLQDKQEVAWRDDIYRIYYFPGVSPADTRLVDDGQIYNIVSVTELGRRQGLELICTLKDNQP
jgi:SPP1 family predicted phage head-tail adaptor